MGRRIDFASICKAAAYIIAVPFAASIPGLFVCMTGKAELVLLAVPFAAVLIYAILYKRINVKFAAMCNGAACLFLLIWTEKAIRKLPSLLGDTLNRLITLCRE